MDFWAWFWIWTALITASLAAFGYLGYELFIKAGAIWHQGQRLKKQIDPLIALASHREPAKRPEESLLTPGATFRARKNLLRAREEKAQARQRRLIARLKDFKPQESRFRK